MRIYFAWVGHDVGNFWITPARNCCIIVYGSTSDILLITLLKICVSMYTDGYINWIRSSVR